MCRACAVARQHAPLPTQRGACRHFSSTPGDSLPSQPAEMCLPVSPAPSVMQTKLTCERSAGVRPKTWIGKFLFSSPRPRSLLGCPYQKSANYFPGPDSGSTFSS